MKVEVANPEVVVLESIAAAWRPSPPVDLEKWAIENIVFTKRESPYPGPYNARQFAYFAEILTALGPDDPCRIVTVKGSAQVGKTVLANIFLGGTQCLDPCDFMFVHPTEDNARRWSRLKLKPMLKGTTALSAIFPERSRDGADAVLLKEHALGLGSILISGANSPSSLSQVTMPRQVQDDLAKWEMNIAGDPESQADSRSRSAEFAKIFKTSTPLIMPGCRITKSYEAGSQEQPYVPCPHCGHMHVLEWENMLAGLDADRPEDAHFTCPDCGGVIEEHHRPAMRDGLEWRAHNPAAKRFHRSFYIWSAYSDLQSWSRIAQEYFKAKGDPSAEQVFLNDAVGRAYETRGEAPAWEKLRERAESDKEPFVSCSYARGTVPKGALVITVGIDCQVDRVEWQAVGWGRDFRRYVIEYGVIPGHISDATCRLRLDALLMQTWPNSFGRAIGVDRAAIDGNAWTEDVWDWARRYKMARLIMVRGRGGEQTPRLMRVKRERNEKTGKLMKWAGRFFNFGADVMKMALYRDLAKEKPDEKGFVAFPRGLEDEYYRQVTAERRTAVKRHGFTLFRWTKDPQQANEGLDTMLQAEAAATNWGIRGLPDRLWLRLEQERETPPPPVEPKPDEKPSEKPATTTPAPTPVAQPQPRRRRQLSRGI